MNLLSFKTKQNQKPKNLKLEYAYKKLKSWANPHEVISTQKHPEVSLDNSDIFQGVTEFSLTHNNDGL